MHKLVSFGNKERIKMKMQLTFNVKILFDCQPLKNYQLIVIV